MTIDSEPLYERQEQEIEAHIIDAIRSAPSVRAYKKLLNSLTK